MAYFFPFLSGIGLTHIIIPAANSILILKTETFLRFYCPVLSSAIFYLSEDLVALLKKGTN